jgi:hypothetical protein
MATARPENVLEHPAAAAASQAELLATLIARLLEGRKDKVALIESPRVESVVDLLSEHELQVRVHYLR